MMLRVEHIRHAYGGVEILADVSYTVEKGIIVGIIGPNGSGKSTLLNIMSGLLKPSSGSVWWEDVNIVSMRPHAVRRQGIARMFQQMHLCGELNVQENIGLGIYTSHTRLAAMRWCDAASGTVSQAAAACGLGAPQLRAYPCELSFFEQRMVELARCLVVQPRLLLLDELTSGFTTAERQQVAGILARLKPAMTIVMVEHDMDLVHKLSDRVIVLAEGTVLMEGTATTVLHDRRVAEVYLGKEYVAG